jgi:hypothetical protein
MDLKREEIYGYPAALRGMCALLAAALLFIAACSLHQPLPPPPPPFPARVITQDGIVFYVQNFRLPGTRQDLQMKQGEAKTWVPLSIVGNIHFRGPEKDRYRLAEILLLSGEKLKGEVFVDTLVEGSTDVGYWNINFTKVERVDLVDP